MKLRLKCRVALGDGFQLQRRERTDDRQDRERQQYQRCGGGVRIIRKKVGVT